MVGKTRFQDKNAQTSQAAEKSSKRVLILSVNFSRQKPYSLYCHFNN